MEQPEVCQQRIVDQQNWLINHYPALWLDLIKDWESPSSEDRVWLTYSANYLFRTGNIRWAIDPYQLKARLPGAPDVKVGECLSPLDFVLLTHMHADHYDADLIKALKHTSIRWVVPEFLKQNLLKLGLNEACIKISQPLKPLEISGLTILPFEGLHIQRGKNGVRHGVPEMGYLVEHQGRRWLFPGDTRKYDPEGLPAMGPVDVVFAHLWLGRNRALAVESKMVDEFCRFYLAFKPVRIVILHLQEIGRGADDYWDVHHYELVRDRLALTAPEVVVESMFTGMSAPI